MIQNNKYLKVPSSLVLSCVPLFLLVIYFLKGFSLTHDAISWHGAYHFYYSQIGKGIIPYWNPYSQTGTPFFVYYQSLGLLDPFHFLFIGLNKITGCSTLTSYIAYYLSCYYLFVLGTYYTLKFITEDKKISLLFSLILCLACCPTFLRQNGALLPFYLIPFITYYLLSFFKENDAFKKGMYLFLSFFLSAISVNIHIASGLFFYIFLLLVFVFVLKIGSVKQTIEFAKSRSGIAWISVSCAMFILMVLPVLALYIELHYDNEMFPTIRFLQKNENNLAKLYASDFIAQNIFSDTFTNGLKTSVTTGNLLGLIFEPFPYRIYPTELSEIKLFVGTFPLLCFVVALKKPKNRMVYLFSAVALFIFFIMYNFRTLIVADSSVLQVAISTIFPLLNMMEVYQNFGILFLFCLIIVGAIGFKKIIAGNKQAILYVAITLFFLKHIIILFVLAPDFGGTLLSLALFMLGLVVLVLFCIKQRNRLVRFVKVIKPIRIVLILLLIELLFFNYNYAIRRHFGSKDYYRFLKNEEILKTRNEDTYINYRDIFANPKESRFPPNNTFFGFEIYKMQKVMFPMIVWTKYIQKKYPLDYRRYRIPAYDHFYMTEYYYDYIANIDISRQLVTSSVVFPIVNFFPKKNVIYLEDKYEVVKRINQSSIVDLGRCIFIERTQKTKRVSYPRDIFYNSLNYISITEDDILPYLKYSNMKYLGNSEATINVKQHNVNSLSLSVDTPIAGYLFFGDGFSKHWKAFVDGKQTMIEKTNLNFKSVFIPEGKHEVMFKYDPALFRYSLYVYVMGLFLANVICIWIIYLNYFRRE